MKTLWRKNQENSSDRISHAWAPLNCKKWVGLFVYLSSLSLAAPTPTCAHCAGDLIRLVNISVWGGGSSTATGYLVMEFRSCVLFNWPASSMWEGGGNGAREVGTRSRIHERTISLRFLSIILRVFRLEVSVWFVNRWEGGMIFYQVFLVSPWQKV